MKDNYAKFDSLQITISIPFPEPESFDLIQLENGFSLAQEAVQGSRLIKFLINSDN